MKTLDSFHPFLDEQETANPAPGCSAHYFEIEGSMLGAAWYGQGLRLLDISNARDVRAGRLLPRQRHGHRQPDVELVGRRLPLRGDKERARRQTDYVYLFDMSRGVEVLKRHQRRHRGEQPHEGRSRPRR